MDLEPTKNVIYLADARRMTEVPNESVALVVTSPPYFNIKDYSLDGHQVQSHSRINPGQIGDISNFRDYIDSLLEVWMECARVLRPNGKLVINTPLMPMLKREYSTHENRHIFDLNSEIQQSILGAIGEMFLMDTYIWNRTNPSKSLMFGSYPFPTNFYAQNTIEFVTVYVKAGKSPTFPPELKESSRLEQSEWVEMTKQVWNFPVPNKGDKAFGAHAALMPEQIAERCIRLYSMVEDVVLDPFSGSGTTLKVAHQLGRKFIGYEIAEGYSSLLTEKTGIKPHKPRRARSKQSDENGTLQIPDSLIDKVRACDFQNLTKRIPSGSVDVVCVDPPYNLGVADWDSFSSHNEFMSFTESWLRQAVRILRPGGALWVFNTPKNAAHILVFLEKQGLELRNWITWNKKDGLSYTRNRFAGAQETILYFTKRNGSPTFNAEAVRVPYESTERINAAKSRGILKNGKRWFPNENGKLCTDVWQIPSDRHVTKVRGKVKKPKHPTIKPIELMERILLSSSNERDVVVDFFCGSGSTLVAAKRLNRRFVGSDLSSEFVELAEQRLLETNWGDGLHER